jgi:HTH-type transcriptional regulator, transcriptional repressor of NAD biosynthesis genes
MEASGDMTLGLVLGKFAPLHRGHESMIRAGLDACDGMVVLVYDCPELDSPLMDVPPVEVRAEWVRRLFPKVEVLIATDAPTEIGLEPRITTLHDAYLRRRLNGYPITHFFSSEPYGEHVSMALGAKDCRVDMARMTVPISATQIRESLFEHRHFLDPVVYRDLVVSAVLLGAPSTGKTTLAKSMAERLGTVWMPEYGREYWERHQQERRLSSKQLLEIALGHRQREDRLLMEARQVFMVDTDATTTLQFALQYHGSAESELHALADQCRQRYDLFFLCETDIPYENSWDRSGEVHRQQMQQAIESDLSARGTPLVRLRGSLEERMLSVEQALKQFTKRSKWC